MSKKISNPPANFPESPAPPAPSRLTKFNNSDICLFCGRSYNEHKDGETQPVTTHIGLCLLLKQGFVPKSQAGLRLTKENN